MFMQSVVTHRKNPGHFCVDYCQPPEHSDLCYASFDHNPVTNHFAIEAEYWRAFKVVVTTVIRRPELDNLTADDFSALCTGESITAKALLNGSEPATRAYEVRWRADIGRDRDKGKRLHRVLHTYNACPFINCGTDCQFDDVLASAWQR